MARNGRNNGRREAAPVGYARLRLAQDDGEVVYFAPTPVMDMLTALERRFAPRMGGSLFFEDDEATRLTPFAGRLFQQGGVQLNENGATPRRRVITGVNPAVAGKLTNTLELFFPEIPDNEDIVIPESDLPEHGRLAAIPEQLKGPHGSNSVLGLHESDDPVEVLENILYGRTGKDDPESSHYAEHMINDGVDRD